jgi:predicted acylesterase/phospholipase RssA
MVQHSGPPFCLPATDIELVLAAGGMNGFRHIGVIEELEAQHIPIGTVTGVSVGAIVAAFYTNGYSLAETSEIFLEALKDCKDPITVILQGWKNLSSDLLKITMESFLRHDPISFVRGGWVSVAGQMADAMKRSVKDGMSLRAFMRCLSLPDPVSFSIGGCVDLAVPMRDMVKRYKLKPNPRLRILAADLFKQEFVVFEGEDYDLAHALASACSLPKVFRPQWDEFRGGRRLLGDGATIHYSPADFCDGSAIFSTFRPAREVPAEIDNWLYLFFTECEIHCPLAGNHRFVDRTRHIVIETGDPDVSGLNFGLSPERCKKMRSDARLVARQELQRAREEGRLANLPGG